MFFVVEYTAGVVLSEARAGVRNESWLNVGALYARRITAASKCEEK